MKLSRLITIGALACLSAILLMAQTETGQITGTVIDATGAAIANATITVKSATTGATRTVQSNDSGGYTLSSLLPGEYTVGVTAPGFSRFENRVTVIAGGKTSDDVRLQVGTTETTLEVSEAAVTINTETQTLNNDIDARQIVELPTLTRNPYALIGIAGNVSDTGIGTRGVGFSINGQRESSTNVLLDGSSNNDEWNGNVGQQVPLDSVQEINVVTSNFTAEFGRASGGIVNVVTKAGTNGLHGTL